MANFSPIRFFRLSSGGLECDVGGLRLGDAALLARDARGIWAARNERDISRDLSRVYGCPVDVRTKMAGVGAVATALQSGDVAKAQITALLLRLPDPLPLSGAALDKTREQRLLDLFVCDLLKADADWDEQHPRTGSAPNPGWFARKPEETPEDEAPKTAAKPNEGAPSSSHKLAFAGVEPLLAEKLSQTTLTGLLRLAGRFSAAGILFDAIFIPSANPIVEEGPVPGRPDVTYRWAHDEAQVTFKALIGGEWRIVAAGARAEGGVYRQQDGKIIARVVLGPGTQATLITTVGVLDRALAGLESASGQPASSLLSKNPGPNLCPAPTPEPKTTKLANSIAYQEYVSKLPYGLAIHVYGVDYDGCDPPTGDLQEAKADIDHLFDKNDNLYEWVDEKNDPQNQMRRQARAAQADGRIVIWHAQTEKGYRGLKKIADHLDELNLFVIYDPN
jgi:hypothetical protein